MRGWAFIALWFASNLYPSDEYVPLKLPGRSGYQANPNGAYFWTCPPRANSLRPPTNRGRKNHRIFVRPTPNIINHCLRAAPPGDGSQDSSGPDDRIQDPVVETSLSQAVTQNKPPDKKKKNSAAINPGSVGAVCLVPPEKIRVKIESLRAQMDGNLNRSLSVPQAPLLFFFLKPEEMNMESLNQAKVAMQSGMTVFPRFNMTMDEMSVQLHRNEWSVWISPKNASIIRMLHTALSELFPRYGEIAPTVVEFLPHISLGTWASRSEAISALERAKPTFAPISWEVSSVCIMTSARAGSPFAVWHESELNTYTDGGSSELSSLLMEAKKEFWEMYQAQKEFLALSRQLIKVKSSLERLRRQNLGRIQRLVDTFAPDTKSERTSNNSTKAYMPAEPQSSLDMGETILQGSKGDDVGSAVDDDEDVLAGSGSSSMEVEEAPDTAEDDDDEGGDDDIVQEGDDEGVLLRVRTDGDAQRRQRAGAGPNDAGSGKGKFLRLTRRVLQDLQATSMWDAQGVGADTVDLESLNRNVAQAGLNKPTLTSSQPQRKADKQRSRGSSTKGDKSSSKIKNNSPGKADGKSTNILLLRHGQSTWNAEGRWQGQADMPLSQLGVAQSALAAVRLGAGDMTNIFGSINSK
jgi:hypothetical protein